MRTPAVSSETQKNYSPDYFRGIFHVHSEFSPDSKVALATVVKTARKARLDFVVVTDHNTLDGRAAYQKMPAPHEPLLIFGDEITTPDGHLIALGISHEPPESVKTSQALIDWIHQSGGWAVVAHPVGERTPWKNWNVRGADGMEIYNFAYAFYLQNKLKLSAKASFLSPRGFLKSANHISEKAFQLWNEQLARGGNFAAFGGTDAHIHSRWLGFSPESFILYFSSVTMYVRADSFSEEKILESLGKGRSFIAFEARGTVRGFSFTASVDGRYYEMGDKIINGKENPVLFSIGVSQTAEIHLIRDGILVKQQKGRELSLETKEPGLYRVEIYRCGKLWIISNPIYFEVLFKHANDPR